MTNRELLNLPPPLLSERDKQRLFLLRGQATARPCPACHQAVNVFDAAGIDIDHDDFGSMPRQQMAEGTDNGCRLLDPARQPVRRLSFS